MATKSALAAVKARALTTPTFAYTPKTYGEKSRLAAAAGTAADRSRTGKIAAGTAAPTNSGYTPKTYGEKKLHAAPMQQYTSPQKQQTVIIAEPAYTPPAYQSKWTDTLNGLWEMLRGRGTFSYDPAQDPLYRQYRALYLQQGANAMRDTLGQAAALTGGYGSSYAQSAAQQAYDSYLQQLNAVVPQLADAALARYTAQGDELLQRYQAALSAEEQDYRRYRDALSDAQKALVERKG